MHLKGTPIYTVFKVCCLVEGTSLSGASQGPLYIKTQRLYCAWVQSASMSCPTQSSCCSAMSRITHSHLKYNAILPLPTCCQPHKPGCPADPPRYTAAHSSEDTPVAAHEHAGLACPPSQAANSCSVDCHAIKRHMLLALPACKDGTDASNILDMPSQVVLYLTTQITACSLLCACLAHNIPQAQADTCSPC